MPLSARINAAFLIILVGKFANSSINQIIYNVFDFDKTVSGHFVSPNFPGKYPQDVRYFYIFVGTDNHQVKLTFTHFNIEGLSHSCDKDYLDIYIEMKGLPDKINITKELFEEPLLGRFCGHSLQFIPNTIVSKNHIIVLDFFSDKNTQKSYNQDDHMGQLGFKGLYLFRVKELFLRISPDKACHYLISSKMNQSGYIQSPNYPGLLPSPLECIYEFQSANVNQRIELDFLKFNLFQQEEMCPVEYVEIVDEPHLSKDSRSVAGRLCGQRSTYRFVSSQNRAYLRLVVLAGREYMKEPRNIDLYKDSLQNTGFKIKYHFSEHFVSPRKLSNNHNRIRGSECDILIQSTDRSRGVLVSAGMDSVEVMKSTTCNYYFFGIHNSQNMETVLLDFSYFYIPSIHPDNCTSGSLTMFSAKFTLKDIIKRRRSVSIENVPDKVLCGDVGAPFSIRSRNPVFVLKLNVTKMKSESPIGFKLSYRFLKDFGIPGSMVTEGECHYRYESQVNGVRGLINSPFYSSFYPNNVSCRYDLLANMDEMIRIVFKVFQTAEDVSPKLPSSHDVHLSCHQDFLSVSEIIRTRSGHLRTDNTERYCGTTIPGLLVSQQNSIGFTLVFQANSMKNGPGFLANYEFLKKHRLSTDKCGETVNSKLLTGLINSPRFPGRYPQDLICEWNLHSNHSSSRLLLLFTSFQVEGTAKSCSNAVVRVYEGPSVSPQLELCGTDSAIPAYESKSNYVRVRFLTDVTAKGAKGFQLIWTRILPRLNTSCPEYLCIHSGHCVNKSLTCNGIINCGSYFISDGSTMIDDSDEVAACPIQTNHTYLYTGLAVVVIILSLVTAVVLYFIHKNKDLLKHRLRQKVVNDSEGIDQTFSTQSHSFIKERPTSSLSGSVRTILKSDHDRSIEGSLVSSQSKLNHHHHHRRQLSFDPDRVSTKQKSKDNVDAISDCNGSFYLEKLQKISIV